LQIEQIILRYPEPLYLEVELANILKKKYIMKNIKFTKRFTKINKSIFVLNFDAFSRRNNFFI